MDRRRVWPDFRAEHVLYEDDDVIAVHKPSGVSSQAAHPDRPDDLVTRLRSFLTERDGKDAYLGVHQRLDRDTTGVMLFTKNAGMNKAIADQLESRALKKRYVAGVIGWPKGKRREMTLDDDLAKAEDGRMEVVPRVRGQRSPKKGQRAITHVVVRAEKGERALLNLTLETGRTHQARVQLDYARAPIAGDDTYGARHTMGAAPRLMLHAAAIELDHPRTKKKLIVKDDLAREEMDAWLETGDRGFGIYDDRGALDRAMALATERRWGLGRSFDRDPAERRTTAFRLINEDGDALPGLAVDVYGEHLVAQIYASDEWEKPGRKERALDALDRLGFAGVYLKLRPKQSNTLVDTRRDDLAPKNAVRGADAPEVITVHEEGVPYAVRLGDGLSTGIFLDQRLNRRVVRELASASAKRIANLFSYTCAFSIVAALGGARDTVSVDASLAALMRGREGFALAGMETGKTHTFVGEDVFAWMARMAKAKTTFDLVIVDPPSYSSTKKRRFVAESDYDELIALAAAIVAPNGRILACCNHRGMLRVKLRRLIHEGARSAKREVIQLKDLPDTPEFPGPPGRDVHMKSMLLTLR